MYTQYRFDATTRKKIRHCVLFNGFGQNIDIYGSDGHMSHYDIEENTSFNAGDLIPGGLPGWYGIMIGSGVQATDDRVIRNMTYGNAIGYYSFASGVANLTMIDNYMPDGMLYQETDTFIEDTGNWNEKYLGWPFEYPTSGKRVFVYSDDYNENKGFVTIYNWDLAESVDVDLSYIKGLSAGDTVTVRNVQDYFVDIKEYVLDENKNITVSMTDHTVAAPAKWDAPATTFPQFGCFVIEKG
jgi:hypothetical protein